MSTFLKALQNISLIRDVKEVTLDDETQARLLTAPNGKERVASAMTRSKEVRVYRIVYTSHGHAVIGFVVEPRARAVPFPCIIYNRGGSGEFGKITTEQLFLHLARVASWGYVVIASQYSGNDGGEGKDEMGGADLEDVLVLQKILKKIPQADATRIGMYGGSRGGMMTYLCLARVKWLKAAVSVAGLADLFRQEELRPDMKKNFKNMFAVNRESLKRRSAVHWVNKFCKKTPVLLLHGSADWRVSPLDSLDLSREMLCEKIPHRLVLFEGADHNLSEFRPQRFELIRLWMERFVKKGEALPDLKLHGE